MWVCTLCKGRKSIWVEIRRNVGIEPVDIGGVLTKKSYCPCTLGKPIKPPSL